jgi:hypothetical protein
MKLNGYRASHRNRWLLVTQRILSPQEFLLFEYYLDLMDFDKSHGEAFSTFEAFLDDVLRVFNKHEDTIRIWHNGLLTKGFIKIFDEKRHTYTVESPLRYVSGLAQWSGEASKYAKEEKDQTHEFILRNIRFFRPEREKIRLESEEKVDISADRVKNSLSSSKGESIVTSPSGSRKIVVIKQEVRSDAEYRKMYEDDGCLGISPDDMKLADQILAETIEILNEEQETEVH